MIDIFSSRVDITEENIRELEDKSVIIIQNSEKRDKKQKEKKNNKKEECGRLKSMMRNRQVSLHKIDINYKLINKLTY